MKYHDNEIQDVIERGRSAQVLVQLPFWEDVRELLEAMLNGALNDMRAKQGKPEEELAALRRWRTISEVAEQVLNCPMQAIEAAQEYQKQPTRIA